MSETSNSADHSLGIEPQADSEVLPHDQSKGSALIEPVSVGDRGGGLVGSSDLSSLLSYFALNGARRSSPTDVYRAGAAWAADMGSREQRLENRLSASEERTESLMAQVSDLRTENADLKARLAATRQHRLLVDVAMTGGPLVAMIGIDLLKSEHVGAGWALVALGIVFWVVGFSINRIGGAI